MISCAVWISYTDARIFRFTPGNVETIHKTPHGPMHHDSSHAHGRSDHDREVFLTEVAKEIAKHDDRLLICGPGVAKVHLRKFLSDYAPSRKAAITVMPLDDKPDTQIIAFAHSYFKKIDAFDGAADT